VTDGQTDRHGQNCNEYRASEMRAIKINNRQTVLMKVVTVADVYLTVLVSAHLSHLGVSPGLFFVFSVHFTRPRKDEGRMPSEQSYMTYNIADTHSGRIHFTRFNVLIIGFKVCTAIV